MIKIGIFFLLQFSDSFRTSFTIDDDNNCIFSDYVSEIQEIKEEIGVFEGAGIGTRFVEFFFGGWEWEWGKWE